MPNHPPCLPPVFRAVGRGYGYAHGVRDHNANARHDKTPVSLAALINHLALRHLSLPVLAKPVLHLKSIESEEKDVRVALAYNRP